MAALTRAEVLEARARPFVPERKGRPGGITSAGRPRPPAPWRSHAGPPPRKEQAPCCMARRDALGRPPLGFCSPGCIRRPAIWAAAHEGTP